MTGQTLDSTVELLKAEIHDSMTVGTAENYRYQVLIEQMQFDLASEYDWASLHDYWDATVSGQYTAFPTVDFLGNTKSISFDRNPRMFVYFSRTFQPCDFGIAPPEWNTYNPNPPSPLLPQRLDPIQRWGFKPDDPTMFEVWPLPASTPQTVRFIGWRELNTLRTASVLDGTKTLELDSRLVALSVAMDLQTDRLAPSAVRIQQKLTNLLLALRGSDQAKADPAGLGNSTAYWSNPRVRITGMKVIAVA